MPFYEHIFLARQDVTAQQVEDLTNQYKGVIEANGGSGPQTFGQRDPRACALSIRDAGRIFF